MNRNEKVLAFNTGRTLYPVKKRRAGRLAQVRRYTFWGLVFSCALCVMLNLLIGGFPWCLYVLMSCYIFYGVIVTRQLVDASLMQKLLTCVVSVSGLLLLAGYLGDGDDWASRVAVPMVLFGGVVSGVLLFLPNIAQAQRFIMPYFLLLLVGICFPLVVLLATGLFSWANITLLATSAAAAIVTFVFFRQPVLTELKKKLSVL